MGSPASSMTTASNASMREGTTSQGGKGSFGSQRVVALLGRLAQPAPPEGVSPESETVSLGRGRHSTVPFPGYVGGQQEKPAGCGPTASTPGLLHPATGQAIPRPPSGSIRQ